MIRKAAFMAAFLFGKSKCPPLNVAGISMILRSMAVLKIAVFYSPFQRAFVFAQMLLAFVASHSAVSAFVEAVRVPGMGDLPAQQQDDGKNAG